MREVSSDYIAQVKSGARQFGFCVRVYGNGPEPETLWLADIISVDITRSISDQLQIGACMSDRLTLQTKATTLFGGKGKKVEVFYRCTAPVLDWVRLGTFYVEESVTDRGVTAVTAYDMMSRLDKRISWGATSKVEALTFPCAMQDMLNYICARAGVTTDFTCQDITVEKTPDGYTARELISYIAASHGGNARFSPSEVLQIRTYTQTSEVIQYGSCYSMDIASDGGYTVNGILFDRGGDDKIYIDGTASEYDEDADGVVEAYNPFATVGIAEYAWNKLRGLSYSSASIEMPAQNILEPGDVFTIQGADGAGRTAIVIEQTLSASCTGGFVEKISCTAESKNQTRNAENRAEATEREVQNSSGSALTEYEYLTDLSVKCNGIIYTAERDVETGLISKLTDSNNRVFSPKINSGINNVELHNAVFWAVALSAGIEPSSPSGAFAEFLPSGLDFTAKRWKNNLGVDYIVYKNSDTSGFVENSGGVELISSQQGIVYYCEDPRVLYVVFKNTRDTSPNDNSYGAPIVSRAGAFGTIKCASWAATVRNGNICSVASFENSSVDTGITAGDAWHVVCFTRDNDNNVDFYVDGTHCGTIVTLSERSMTLYRGFVTCNSLMKESGAVATRGANIYRYLAIGNVCHKAEEVKKTSNMLLTKYGGATV